jgi:hypothetical protein
VADDFGISVTEIVSLFSELFTTVRLDVEASNLATPLRKRGVGMFFK